MSDLPSVEPKKLKAIICYATCWGCKFGSHFDPPEWHSWADQEDIDHARETGQPDPSKEPCGCHCAGVRESSADFIYE